MASRMAYRAMSDLLLLLREGEKVTIQGLESRIDRCPREFFPGVRPLEKRLAGYRLARSMRRG